MLIWRGRDPGDPRTRFLTSLGFVLPEEVAELAGDRDGTNLSEESLGLLDRDPLLWNIGFYPQLDAAREGRDIFLEDEGLFGALTWSTVLSTPTPSTGLPLCSPPPATPRRKQLRP